MDYPTEMVDAVAVADVGALGAAAVAVLEIDAKQQADAEIEACAFNMLNMNADLLAQRLVGSSKPIPNLDVARPATLCHLQRMFSHATCC